jgi:predicted RNase H-like HicB family nuclease
MRHIIQFRVYQGDKYYVGESIDLPIVTQGKTIDEAVANIREAISFHLKGENLKALGLAKNYSVLVNVELEPTYA